MNFELVSIKKSESHPGDHIVTIKQKQNWLAKLVGIDAMKLTFRGRQSHWQFDDEATIDHEVQQVLQEFWQDHAANDIVQQASEESFPASDPPAWTTGRIDNA